MKTSEKYFGLVVGP